MCDRAAPVPDHDRMRPAAIKRVRCVHSDRVTCARPSRHREGESRERTSSSGHEGASPSGNRFCVQGRRRSSATVASVRVAVEGVAEVGGRAGTTAEQPPRGKQADDEEGEEAARHARAPVASMWACTISVYAARTPRSSSGSAASTSSLTATKRAPSYETTGDAQCLQTVQQPGVALPLSTVIAVSMALRRQCGHALSSGALTRHPRETLRRCYSDHGLSGTVLGKPAAELLRAEGFEPSTFGFGGPPATIHRNALQPHAASGRRSARPQVSHEASGHLSFPMRMLPMCYFDLRAGRAVGRGVWGVSAIVKPCI